MFSGTDLSRKLKFVSHDIYLSISLPLTIFHFGQKGELKIIPALVLASGQWGCVPLLCHTMTRAEKVDEGIFLLQPLDVLSAEASSWLELRALSEC